MIRRIGTGKEAAARLLLSQRVVRDGAEYRRVPVGLGEFEMQCQSVLTGLWIPSTEFPTLDSVAAADGWMVSRSPEDLCDLRILGQPAHKHVNHTGTAEWSVRVGYLLLRVAEETGCDLSFYGQVDACAVTPLGTIVTCGFGGMEYATRIVEREARRIMAETVEAAGGIAVWE